MATKLTKIVANFQAQLSAKLSVGGTSINISTATDKDSVALPAGKYCFIADPGKSNEEHLIGDLSGTALTNIQSVSRQGVKTTGALKEHRVGAVIKLTDFVNLKVLVDMLSGAESLDGTSPLAYDTEPTINDRKQLATAGYVQDVAGGAIGTANPTAAGTVRTTADQGANPRAMSTLVRQQTTPDMTLHVEAFKHAEIDKVLSFAGGNSAAFINPGLAGDLALALNPSNGETFTLTINGTACLFTFVSSIGSTVGNVLIGASAAETRANLTAFINNPGATSATQVGFTGAQLTALGLVSATDDLSLNMFVKAISATVTTLAGAETMAGAGNIWTDNTTKDRIDLLVLQTSDSTLQIRRGTEAASPVAPTPTSGDIVLAQVYCKIGMTSVKDITDGTNGYIAAWYFPQVFRTDVLTSASTTVKQYPLLPAYENLSAGDFLKVYNDNGTAKLKKIVGMGNTHTNFIELTTYYSEQDIKAVFLTDSLVVFVYSKYRGYLCARAASISGKVMTLGSEINLNGTSIAAGWTRYFEISKVNDSSFVVTTLFKYYSDSNLLAIACSVSGTTITQGTGLSLYSYSAYGGVRSLSMCEVESGKFLVAFDAFTRRAVVITVSGTTVSAGATLTLLDNSANSGLLSVAKFNTNKVYLVYGYGTSDTRYVKGMVLTISGTTITAGSENTHHTTTHGDVSGIRLIRHSDNNLLFSWVINTTYEPNFGKLVFSGDTPTYTKISTDVITDGQMVFRDNRLYTRGFTYFIDLSNNVISLFATISTSLFPAVNSFSMFDLSPSGLPIRTGNNSYAGNYYYFDPVLGDYDHADFICCANSSYTAGNNVPLVDLFTHFTGLILGATYYINLAATAITLSNTYQKIGKAISADKILK